MTYLLIALVLAIILSPLMSLRASPRQKHITALRQCASHQGLKVRLSRPAGAREGEGRMDTVIYRLLWAVDSRPSSLRRAEQWLLIRGDQRGDASDWDGWRWLTLRPEQALMADIGLVIESLIDDMTGFEAGPEGLSVYWQEHGEAADVEQLAAALKRLQSRVRPAHSP